MRSTDDPAPVPNPESWEPDPDALLCALVLAPNTYARNRFFKMYEQPTIAKVRRRAARVRGIIRQLTGLGKVRAQVVGEQVLDDRVLLRYSVDNLNYARTTSLTLLEAALVHYALYKHSGQPLPQQEKQLVEQAVARFSDALSGS